MTYSEALEYTQPIESYHWLRYCLHVVRDGHTEDGERIHFVTEKGYDGQIIANAFIFTLK